MPRHTRGATLLGPDRRKLSVMTHSLNFSGSVSNSGSHEAPEASARGSMMENAEDLHDDPTMLPPVPGPKYEQVIRYLEQKYVVPGSPGDKLPTERAIQEKFKVSRQTVRNAIKALLERGLIYNVQGSGTYVADRSQGSYIPRVCSFAEDMERRGLQASTRMLSTQWVEVTEEISRYLSVTIDSSVLLVKRLRLAEGEPIGFELAYLAPEVATCLLETMASGGSRKDPHDNCEYTIEHGMMRMEATLMTEADAEAFNHLPTVGAAAFKVTTTSYTSQGSPVEHSVTLYKGDAYFYEMLL